MINLKLFHKNPLSLQPLIAQNKGFFEKNNVEVDINMIDYLPQFDMSKNTANVGDVTRIFESIHNGIDLVITSDLTETMKIILIDDYKEKEELTIICSEEQSLRIYTEYFFKKKYIQYKILTNVNPAERLSLLNKKMVDGACLIEPFIFFQQSNGYTVVYEGKNHKHNYTCWAFKKDYAVKNREKVLAFHKSLNEATEYFNNLDKEEKLNYAHKLMKFDKNLNNYYSNLIFEKDKQYKFEDLKVAYDWKVNRNSKFKNININNIIFSWDN